MTDDSQVLTVVTATVPGDRERELIEGFRSLAAPEGLLRSQLLRGQEGTWQIQSLWRDLAALRAIRASGEPPQVLALLDRLGADHTHAFFVVEHTQT